MVKKNWGVSMEYSDGENDDMAVTISLVFNNNNNDNLQNITR